MAIAFGSKTKEGTYPVIEIKDPEPLAYEWDTNLKGDHKNPMPVFDPDQQVNINFRPKQITQASVIIR